jgi:hypothetical protein
MLPLQGLRDRTFTAQIIEVSRSRAAENSQKLVMEKSKRERFGSAGVESRDQQMPACTPDREFRISSDSFEATLDTM